MSDFVVVMQGARGDSRKGGGLFDGEHGDNINPDVTLMSRV